MSTPDRTGKIGLVLGATLGLLTGAVIAYAQNLFVEGNIGVGTETPSQKLEVIGSAAFTGSVGVGTPAPGARLDVEVAAGDATTTPLAIDKGTTRYVVVTNGGNVGVGTASPAFRLDVQGQIRATQGTGLYTIHGYCGSAGALTLGASCTTSSCYSSCNPNSGACSHRYYTCSGSCGSTYGQTYSCPNTLVGRLLAP